MDHKQGENAMTTSVDAEDDLDSMKSLAIGDVTEEPTSSPKLTGDAANELVSGMAAAAPGSNDGTFDSAASMAIPILGERTHKRLSVFGVDTSSVRFTPGSAESEDYCALEGMGLGPVPDAPAADPSAENQRCHEQRLRQPVPIDDVVDAASSTEDSAPGAQKDGVTHSESSATGKNVVATAAGAATAAAGAAATAAYEKFRSALDLGAEAAEATGGAISHGRSTLSRSFFARFEDARQLVTGILSGQSRNQHVFTNAPAWVLGTCYRRIGPLPVTVKHGAVKSLDATAAAAAAAYVVGTGSTRRSSDIEYRNQHTRRVAAFMSDVHSRLWMTYRRGFPAICESTTTSDAGWGCMLRSGQMIMAQALLFHYCGREWRYREVAQGSSTTETPVESKVSSASLLGSDDSRDDGVSITTPVQDSGEIYARIIRCFVDQPDAAAPFSIHNMISAGVVYGKRVGEWYGPGSVCIMLRNCMRSLHRTSVVLPKTGLAAAGGTLMHSPPPTVAPRDRVSNRPSSQRETNDQVLAVRGAYGIDDGERDDNDGNDNANDLAAEDGVCTPLDITAGAIAEAASLLRNEAGILFGFGAGAWPPLPLPLPVMYASSDGTVYRDQIVALCSSGEASDCWAPIIILISVRLGLHRFNPDYADGVLKCFQFPQSIGIIGGRPRASLYLTGVQGDRVFYLDPHTVQVARPRAQNFAINSQSFHCPAVLSMPVTDLDPSLAIGFYCRTRSDFEEWWEQAVLVSGATEYPAFYLAKVTPVYGDEPTTGVGAVEEKFDDGSDGNKVGDNQGGMVPALTSWDAAGPEPGWDRVDSDGFVIVSTP